ncbi:MAG: magnesium transporter [Chromatiales bacterium]|jgi:magnesium transporter
MEHPTHALRQRIDDIRELLERFQVEDHLITSKGGPRQALEQEVTRRQQGVELERRLRPLHAADIAELLEGLPGDERLLVWPHIPEPRRGDVLLELDDAVLEGMVAELPPEQLISTMQQLDADDLGYLGNHLPAEMFQHALTALGSEERSWVHASIAYPEDSVGHLMSSEMVVVRDDDTLATVEAMLKDLAELPQHTDKLFVVDQRGVLCGALPLKDILLNERTRQVGEIAKKRVVRFHPEDEAEEAGRAFERYDLISAPVTNERGKLIGRLTVDIVMDYIREESEADVLNVAGVVETEDLFANIWDSARNRWLWLSINLLTAFAISRIIGAFEGTIDQLVALASLMPIIAAVAGNTGNQTAALVIRSLALDQIRAGNVWHLFRKEIAISILNGMVWGLAVGAFAYVFYANLALSAVVTVAMMLSFLIASLIGVGAPMILERSGRDPAMGSSVIVTGLTDAMGFFLFLMLATVLLI